MGVSFRGTVVVAILILAERPNGGHHPRGGCQILLGGQDSPEVHEPMLGRGGSRVGCMPCWAALWL